MFSSGPFGSVCKISRFVSMSVNFIIDGVENLKLDEVTIMIMLAIKVLLLHISFWYSFSRMCLITWHIVQTYNFTELKN